MTRIRLFVTAFFETFDVKARVEGIEILAVELVGQQSQVFAEALIVYDLARSQEANRVDDVGIVAEAQDVVICRPRFLFRPEILVEIGDEEGADALKIFEENGWRKISVLKDLAGRDRVVSAHKG